MTESRPPYQAADGNMDGRDKDGYDKDGYDKDGYDANGLDHWGVSREQKERAFAKLARRFEEQPDSMAALMVEYRRQEGITQETLLAKLEITPAQYSHLALCFVPDPDLQFASDLRKIVAASGANIAELAGICRQVYAMRALPKRTIESTGHQEIPQGSAAKAYSLRMMAARDRDPSAKAMREESADYSAEGNAAAASPAPLAAAAPGAPKRQDDSETPAAEEPDEARTSDKGDESHAGDSPADK